MRGIFSLLFTGLTIKPGGMRTPLTKHFIICTAIGLALLGTSRAIAEDASDPVTIEKDRVLIPGTNISEKDQHALTAILARYDKSLYKINGYVNGKAQKPMGTLPSTAIDPATATRAAFHAKQPHFTGWTLQVGSTSNQSRVAATSNQTKSAATSNQNRPGNTSNQSKPGDTSNQNKPGKTSNQDIPNPSTADASKAKELIKRLTPILRKYSKTQSAR
jgi:hypothetical protein